MRINDTKEYFGKSYTAVEYTEPLDFQPTDDDPQCKICAVEPNYCKMMDECHSEECPFIFVKTEYANAMSTVAMLYQ